MGTPRSPGVKWKGSRAPSGYPGEPGQLAKLQLTDFSKSVINSLGDSSNPNKRQKSMAEEKTEPLSEHNVSEESGF